jgi:allantoicase
MNEPSEIGTANNNIPATNTDTNVTSVTTMTPMINVLSAQAGARILFATDEWFATADHLLHDDPPVFDPDAYCPQGKVMDGWESRRRREPGHDWCIIQLSHRVHHLTAIDVDTAYFTGNQAPAISIWSTDLSDVADEAEFVQALPHATRRLLVQWRSRHDHDHDNSNTSGNSNSNSYLDLYRGTGASPLDVLAAEAACRTVPWTEVLPRQPLQPGYEATRYHHFDLAVDTATTQPLPPAAAAATTHIRLNYFPDGGVARLRLYGTPVVEPPSTTHRPLGTVTTTTTTVPPPLYMPMVTNATCTVVSYNDIGTDVIMPSQTTTADCGTQVSCVQEGGIGRTCTNQHYGTPSNLLQCNSGVYMGDGWETARQPNRPGILVAQSEGGFVDFGNLSEYCIVQLAQPIRHVRRIILDTKHFKGNYPESVQVDGCYLSDGNQKDNLDVDWDDDDHVHWFPLLGRGRMSPHAEHCYDADTGQIVPHATHVSHVRVRLFPDGGLSRVRVYGH